MSGVKNLSSTMNLTMRAPGDAPPQISKKAEEHDDKNTYGEAPPTPSAVMPEQIHHKRPHMTGNRAARRFSEVAVQDDLNGTQTIPEEQQEQQTPIVNNDDVTTNTVENSPNTTPEPVVIVQPIVDTPKPVEQVQDVSKTAVIIDQEKPQQEQQKEQKTEIKNTEIVVDTPVQQQEQQQQTEQTVKQEEKGETTKPAWFNTKWTAKPKTTEQQQKPIDEPATKTTKIEIADEDKEEYEALVEDDIPPPQYSYLATISASIWNTAHYVASFIYKTDDETKQESTTTTTPETKKDNDEQQQDTNNNESNKTDEQTQQLENNVKQEESKQIQNTVVQPEPIAVQ